MASTGRRRRPAPTRRTPQTQSAACTTPCTLTWTWSVAPGTMMTSMWRRVRWGDRGEEGPRYPPCPLDRMSPAVEEGPVFALCMAGVGDRHTLGKWIAGLQEANPVLGCTPVVFRLGDGEPTTAGAPGGHPVPRLEAAPPRPVVLGPPDPPRGHRHSTSGDTRSSGGPGAPPTAPGE